MLYILTKCAFFAIIGQEEGRERIIILATKENLEIMAGTKRYFVDGTFDHLPNIFEQLFTIHGTIHGVILPLVYILSISQKKIMYKKAYQALKEAEVRLF